MRAVFSELTQKRIDGLDWLDNFPEAATNPSTLDVVLVNQGFKPEVWSFATYEPGNAYDHSDLNLFSIISYEQGLNSWRQFVYIQDLDQAYDLTQAWESKVFFAGFGDLSIDNLVFPITSIDKRVELSNFLEKEVVKKHGSLFDSRVMGGPTSSWWEYFVFYKSLIDTGMIEHTTKATRDLCLNLFAAYFPERFKYLNI